MSIGRGGVAIREVGREDAGTYICRCHLDPDRLGYDVRVQVIRAICQKVNILFYWWLPLTISIHRARVAETGELEETPILLEVDKSFCRSLLQIFPNLIEYLISNF